jgi:hypothetical protein
MHSNSSTLRKPDNEFLAQANTIMTICTSTEAADWEIPATFTSQLTTLTTAANTTYAVNSDKATKNLTTSTAKKTAFGELKNFLGTFIKFLQGNLLVPDDALILMGIPSRHHHAHQPIPRPTEAPAVSLVRHHDEVTVYVARPEHDQPTHSLAEAGFAGFMVRWRLEGDSQDHTETVERLHLTLHFAREDEGKKLILAAAWVNPRLEPGPFSPDVTEILG